MLDAAVRQKLQSISLMVKDAFDAFLAGIVLRYAGASFARAEQRARYRGTLPLHRSVSGIASFFSRLREVLLFLSIGRCLKICRWHFAAELRRHYMLFHI